MVSVSKNEREIWVLIVDVRHDSCSEGFLQELFVTDDRS